MMKQLAALINAQVEIVATLSTKMNGGGSGSGRTTDKNKVRPGFHIWTYCKQEVYHK